MDPAIEIPMDLRRHCIETEIKRCYNRFISAYFKSLHMRSHLEDKISLLESVMETCDFPRLRSEYPELSGHCDVKAAICVDSGGQRFIRIHETVIYLK